jgi:hypothetical protein
MDKGRRNELGKLKYKRRVKESIGRIWHYKTKAGKEIIEPKASEVIKDGGLIHLKDNPRPCSCFVCSPNKYNRRVKHKKLLLVEN